MKQDNSLIGYCGLYCEDCHGFNGRIPDLARDLRMELRKARYDEFAEFISGFGFGKDFKNYDECYKVLGAMVKFRCRKGNRNHFFGEYMYCLPHAAYLAKSSLNVEFFF